MADGIFTLVQIFIHKIAKITLFAPYDKNLYNEKVDFTISVVIQYFLNLFAVVLKKGRPIGL
jgi:hypothetical protein